jgi:hypothetical protein
MIRRNETYNSIGIDKNKETLEGLIWIGIPKIVKSPPRYPEFETVFKSLD